MNRPLKPVRIEGRTITHTFWGKAWCTNLEAFSDYSNRLPRGRTYARHGAITDLQIKEGQIWAEVRGRRFYEVKIEIAPLPDAQWQSVRAACGGQINSLVELLSGKLSNAVMEAVSSAGEGLFPTPAEIKLNCSCPDWAVMCKHVAATLYGVGARLDNEPEMLFTLRGVQASDMIEAAINQGIGAPSSTAGPTLENEDLASVFGIDIDFGEAQPDASAPIEIDAQPELPSEAWAPDLDGLPPSAIEIYGRVIEGPGQSRQQLMDTLEFASSTISTGLSKLKARGLIELVGGGREGGYYPVADGE